jgi:hypothetical protein
MEESKEKWTSDILVTYPGAWGVRLEPSVAQADGSAFTRGLITSFFLPLLLAGEALWRTTGDAAHKNSCQPCGGQDSTAIALEDMLR